MKLRMVHIGGNREKVKGIMKRYKSKGSTISVYLEQEIIDKLDKVAEEHNESRSYVISSIILNATREVNRNEKRKYYTPCN